MSFAKFLCFSFLSFRAVSLFSSDWVTGNGNWSNPGSWSAGVPNAVGAVANFPDTVGSATATMDIAVTLGTLTFGQDGSVSITGSQLLTMHDSVTNQIFANNGMSTIAVPLTGVGPINLLGNSTLTVSGGVSGGTSILNNGPALTLLGTNTYSGGTTVSNGTLQLGSAAAFPSGTNLTANGGTFDLSSFSTTVGQLSGTAGAITLESATLTTNTTTNSTFGGVISGPGGFTKQGTSTLILTGANAYGGGTFISAGTLQGNTTSLQGNIHNDDTLIFDQAMEGTYEGSLAGTGTFEKQNSGNLILTGSNQQGTVVVSAGQLTVNGSLTSTIGMTVNVGTTLAGTGTITANVTNGGTIAPGNSIGTMNLVGNQVFTSTSTLEVEFNATSADLLNVTGNVTINPGATLSLMPETTYLTEGTLLPIVTTTTGISGAFTNIQNPMPLVAPQIIYTADSIFLDLAFAPFVSLVSAADPGAVAAALDELNPDPTSDLGNVFATLRTVPNSTVLKTSLAQMHPALLKGLPLTQENNMINVRYALTDRMEKLYLAACKCEEKNRRFSLWAGAYGDKAKQNSIQSNIGFDAKTFAGLAGMDFKCSDNFYLGVSGAYTHSLVSWSHSAAHGDIKSYYGSLYATYFTPRYFIEAGGIGASSTYHAIRNIDFLTIHRSAKNTHQGWEALGYFKIGAPYDIGHIKVTPFGDIDWISLQEDGYTETHAQSLDLHVKKKYYSLFRWEAGLDFRACINLSTSCWTPFLKITGIREIRFAGRHYTVEFKNTDSEFTVAGMKPDRTLVAPGGGINILMCKERVSINARYDGEFGKNFYDNRFSGELIISF